MLCHKIENHFRSFFVAMLRTEFCFMSVDPESQIVSSSYNAFYRLLTVLELRRERHTHMLVLREGHRRHRRHRGTGAQGHVGVEGGAQKAQGHSHMASGQHILSKQNAIQGITVQHNTENCGVLSACNV